MSPSEPLQAEDDETILEFAVRKRLSKEQLVELSSSLGGSRQGSRDDLAEQLLGIKGLKVRDTLGKLSIEDLKVIARRFDVPEPARPTSASALFGSILGDEKTALIKRIEEVASKQRGPRPRAAASGTRTEPSRPQGPSPVSAAESAHPPEREDEKHPPPREVGVNITVVTQPPGTVQRSGLPEVVAFIESYRFGASWPDEKHYEAELLGALRAKFTVGSVFNQVQVQGGGRVDIEACKVGIEVKVPTTTKHVEELVTQVMKYQRHYEENMIAVIIGRGVPEHKVTQWVAQMRSNKVTVIEKP